MKTIKNKLFFSIDTIGAMICIISLVNFRTWIHPFLFCTFGLIFLLNVVNTLKGNRHK